jgi:hypothetical protein
MADNSASAKLSKLVAARVAANRRVSDVERQMSVVGQEREAARSALIEHERRGGKPSERDALEANLRAAEEAVHEPWDERVKGAQAAVRDADVAVRRHVHDHLRELLDGREAVGAEIAARMNEHAAAIQTDYAAWQSIAAEISQLAALVGRVGVNDVSRSKPATDELARAAAALLAGGGEVGPHLHRDAAALHSPESAVA